ncbi:MAG: BspC domain-containing protein [Janthinobacterium lividum]
MPLSIPSPRLSVFLRRFFSPSRHWFGGLTLTFGLVLAAPTFADQADSHDALVEQLIQQQHASPLVADCAAHAAYVVPTSPVYDHVEFLNTAFDDQHATVEPWNQPFDTHKQRITVETLVSVSGLGYRKSNGERSQPDLLKLRCGYVADKLLAFGYNEPESTADVPLAPAPGRHGRARRGNASSRHHAARTGQHATARASVPHGAAARKKPHNRN